VLSDRSTSKTKLGFVDPFKWVSSFAHPPFANLGLILSLKLAHDRVQQLEDQIAAIKNKITRAKAGESPLKSAISRSFIHSSSY
jgi:hypothetical protein